jgi:hypothetical protein
LRRSGCRRPNMVSANRLAEFIFQFCDQPGGGFNIELGVHKGGASDARGVRKRTAESPTCCQINLCQFLMQYILHQQYPMQRCCIESSRGGRLQISDGLARGYIGGGGAAMQLVLSTTSRVHAPIHVWQSLPSTMSRVHASIHVWRMCLCVCACVCVAGCQLSGLSVDRSVGLSPDSSVGVRLCVQLLARECVRACAHMSP